MTAATWLTLLGSLGIPVIVTALFKLIENRITLRHVAPKAAAEVQDIGLGSQRKVIETLTAENERLGAKIAQADAVAEDRERRNNERVERLTILMDRTRVDLASQLQTVRDENRQFRARVEALLVANNIAIPPWWPTE